MCSSVFTIDQKDGVEWDVFLFRFNKWCCILSSDDLNKIYICIHSFEQSNHSVIIFFLIIKLHLTQPLTITRENYEMCQISEDSDVESNCFLACFISHLIDYDRWSCNVTLLTNFNWGADTNTQQILSSAIFYMFILLGPKCLIFF